LVGFVLVKMLKVSFVFIFILHISLEFESLSEHPVHGVRMMELFGLLFF
jgi:hypothetical protein